MSASLVKTDAGLLEIPGCEFKPTSLTLPERLSFDHWERIGRQLQLADLAVQWWIGDWLNYGEARYGEKYSQALDEFGRKKQTLMNYAFVAKAIETSRRREVVDFSTHAEVAGLPDIEQDRILAKAAKDPDTTTVRDVRREVHRVKRQLGKLQSEIELLHTPEVQAYLQRYIETLQTLEEEVPLTAKFLRNMVQNHTAQAFWQKNRTIDDDCQIIHKVVKDSEVISGDDLFTWLNEHGYFMSDPELEERLEYMERDDVRLVCATDAGHDGKQEDRRGSLPKVYVTWFKKWDRGGKRSMEDDDED